MQQVLGRACIIDICRRPFAWNLIATGDIYEIPYPRVYIDFTFKWFSFFEFDFLSVAKVECIRKTDFYEVVYVQTSVLFVLEVVGIFAVIKAHGAKEWGAFFRQLQAAVRVF